jgi:hypothetical protein
MSTRHSSTENGAEIPRGTLSDPIGKPSILPADPSRPDPAAKSYLLLLKVCASARPEGLPLPLKLFTVHNVLSIGPAIRRV